MKPAYFNSRLEALRGVAAMMVAVWHSLAVLPGSGVKADIIASIRRLTNGNAAVTLFFVLSGFVLGLSLRKAGACTGQRYLGFCMRRLFRIYPVFLFATLLVVAGLYYSHYTGGLFPSWFNSASHYRQTELDPSRPPSAALVLGNLLLWCPTLNYPTWTLGIELRCSLLLPLLYWWSGRLSGRGKGLLLLAFMLAACLGKWCLLLGSPAAEAIVALFISGFAGCLFLFYLGYLLPEAGPVPAACFHGRRPWSGCGRIRGVTSFACCKGPRRRCSSATCSTAERSVPGGCSITRSRDFTDASLLASISGMTSYSS